MNSNIETNLLENISTNLELKKKKIRPLVFEKKKSNSKIKTLKFVDNLTGKTRHYPTASQEWYNSIYTYNKNYVKSLPVLDNTLNVLLEKYCNMWPEQEKYKKSTRLISKEIKEKDLTGKEQYLLKRHNLIQSIKLLSNDRLSPKKVFVGKGDLKHTNDKVIITLYTYDLSKTHLLSKIRKLIDNKFLTKIPLIQINTKVRFDNKKKKIAYKLIEIGNDKFNEIKKVFLFNRRLTLDEYLTSSYNFFSIYLENPYSKANNFLSKFMPSNFTKKIFKISKKEFPVNLASSYFNLISYSILKVNIITNQLKIILKYYKYLTLLVEKKIINSNEKYSLFTSKINKLNIYKYYNRPKFIMTKFKEKRFFLATLLRFASLIYGHDVKFRHPIIVSKLKHMISNLYDKQVEFNIVQLKKMHLNSDIYTQIVATKLKNRNNKLYSVLKGSLDRVNLPIVNRQGEIYSKFNKKEYLLNIIKNKYINFMFNNKLNNNDLDPLNNLLLNTLPIVKKNNNLFKSKSYILENFLFNNNIKHRNFGGIRVEAKGRLTRRFTAERSVFKLEYKGGLKTVDSSFKGLSVVMLRGYLKNNLQYSVVNSKNRNGAYGVKGWVGYK